MSKDKIILNSNNLIDIYGPKNETINLIKSHFVDLKIIPRGVEVFLEGCDTDIKQAKKIFTELINYAETSNSLMKEDVQKILLKGISNDQKRIHSSFVLVRKNGSQIQSRNRGQQDMINLSVLNKLLFALGPAGTGKTYMAIALASNALKEQHVKKIILTRPAVEAGENLGFLPGDLYDKLSPYMKPLYDSLYDIFEKEKLNFYLKNNQIEIVPLAFMRGRTLDNAFVILDEAQNATIQQMKMFLTRMGPSSQFIVCGDMSQVDLPKNQESGLRHASNVLKSINGIGFVNFNEEDVVRHKLVKNIIKAYKK